MRFSTCCLLSHQQSLSGLAVCLLWILLGEASETWRWCGGWMERGREAGRQQNSQQLKWLLLALQVCGNASLSLYTFIWFSLVISFQAMANKATHCWLVGETTLCTPISVLGWKTAVDAALIWMWEKDYLIAPWGLLHFLGLPLPFQHYLSCKLKKTAPDGPSKLGDLALLRLVDNVIIRVSMCQHSFDSL